VASEGPHHETSTVPVGDLQLVYGSAVPEQQPLTEQEAFKLGVDAYIYGHPLLVMDSVRRVMTNVAVPAGKSAPMGQFAHFRSFPDASKRGPAGSNVDTLYSSAWLGSIKRIAAL
jgi:hypothetical protein